MITKSDLTYIRNRWNTEHRISADAVQKLLDAADKALTMQAANDLRQRRGGDGLSDLLGDMFGRR